MQAQTPQRTAPPAPARPPRRQIAAAPFDPKLGPSQHYSKTPNELRFLIRGKLSGALQRDIIYCIQLHTWGSTEKREWCTLSLRQIATFCDDESKNVHRALADLAGRGIIAAEDGKGCGRPSKRYKLTPHKWESAPEYKAKPPIPDTSEIEDGEEEGNETQAAPRRKLCDKLLVRPGSKAERVPGRLEPRGKEAVDFRIEYNNSGSHPVEVTASARADILTITLSAQATNNHSGIPTREQTAKAVENRQLVDYRSCLTEVLQAQWQIGLDDGLLDQVVAAANGAPVDIFRARCLLKFKSNGYRRPGSNRHTPGLLVHLAADAAKDYAAQLAAAQAAPPRPDAPANDPSKLLMSRAAAIRAASPNYFSVAAEVERLAESINDFALFENIVAALSFEEQRLMKLAQQELPAEVNAQIEAASKEAARPYVAKMTEAQLQQYKADFVRKATFEAAGLPTLEVY